MSNRKIKQFPSTININKEENNMKVKRLDKTERNKKFEKICMKSEMDLKTYLTARLEGEGKTVVSGNGYLFIDGSLPVLLTAHLDTVHKELPKEIIYKDGKISSPQGIGGDDRCGVYMILQILKELDCPVVFCEQEENGGIGSSMFVKSKEFDSLKDRIGYVIELDRKGSKDAVYYDLDNKDFEDFIEEDFWEGAYGTFSDICHICPELGVAGVNLSCGYYKAHTTDEYVVLAEMNKAIDMVKELIRRTTEKDVFIWKEVSYKEKYNWWRNDLEYYGSGYKYTDLFYVLYNDSNYGEAVDFVDATSEYEAIGKFMENHPTLTFYDICEIGYEDEFDQYGNVTEEWMIAK